MCPLAKEHISIHFADCVKFLCTLLAFSCRSIDFPWKLFSVSVSLHKNRASFKHRRTLCRRSGSIWQTTYRELWLFLCWTCTEKAYDDCSFKLGLFNAKDTRTAVSNSSGSQGRLLLFSHCFLTRVLRVTAYLAMLNSGLKLRLANQQFSGQNIARIDGSTTSPHGNLVQDNRIK